MLSAEIYQRSLALRKYVGLDATQIALAISGWPYIEPDLDFLVDDFYSQILQHEPARRVFSGPEQVARLQVSLRRWLIDLFSAEHDEAFVARRWRVGLRHVELGLESIWVSAAMSRLRDQMIRSVASRYPKDGAQLFEISSAISRLVDLDLALIQDAYQAESVAKSIAGERDFAEGVIETAQAIVMMVTRDGAIVRGNQLLATELGWRADEPLEGASVNCLNLLAPLEREAFREFISRAADGENQKPLETQLLGSRGRLPRVRWHARRFHPPVLLGLPESSKSIPTKADGMPERSESSLTPLVLCVGQDITELSDAQQRLVRSERLAAIGETMAGLAHESRNAFQRSQAALETLSLELEERPSAVKLVARIQRAHDHLLHLYEEVLQFARPVRLEVHPVNLVAIISQTWEHIRQASSEKAVELDLDMNFQAELRADRFALEQLFRNLLENAVEASPQGAAIAVTFANAWAGVDRCVEVHIRDYGVGMSSESISRAFEPFYTTRPRGTGLGLPIARRLIESHGGTLELERAQPGLIAILKIPLQCRPVEFADATLQLDHRRTRKDE